MGIKIAQLLVKNSLRKSRLGFADEIGFRSKPPVTPILCLCYTNHALDQFLESLLQAGVSGVVRVGSRCKRESLAGINLAALRQNTAGRTEKKMRWDRIQAIKSREPVIKELSASLCHRRFVYADAEVFLRESHPELRMSLHGRSLDADVEEDEEWAEDFEASFKAWYQDTCFDPLCRLHAEDSCKTAEPLKKPKQKKRNAFSALSMDDELPDASDPVTELLMHIAAAGYVFFKGAFPSACMLQVVKSALSDANLDAYLERHGVETLEELLTPPQRGKGQPPGPTPVPGVRFNTGKSLTEQGSIITYQFEFAPSAPFGVVALQDVAGTGGKRPSPAIGAGEKAACIEHGERSTRIVRLVPIKGKAEFQLKFDEFPSAWFCPIHETRRSLEQILSVHDMWSFSREERNVFKKYIFENIKEDLISRMEREWQKTATDISDLKAVENSVDLKILEGASIVGMTTTGAANLQAVIKALGPKIIIIEEAAEVLEAHVLANLSQQTQHVIMIGDHMQLRPKTELYHLTVESKKNYNLDLSMFERLVKDFKFQPYTLSHQRRMRPCISALIGNIYPQLQDHAKVLEYPDVRGTEANVFFFDHNHPEDGEKNDESSSKVNEFEANMVVKFARYLLLQGYGPGEITILTPYLGQLRQLKKLMSTVTMIFVDERDEEELLKMQGREDSDFETNAAEERAIRCGVTVEIHSLNGMQGLNGRRGEVLAYNSSKGEWDVKLAHGRIIALKPENLIVVEAEVACDFTVESISQRLRLSTIDNFQGEESTIVLISLVRNNHRGAIGFLKANNRINVLLSRAMHGMFLFGHSPSLVRDRTSKMWPMVLEKLQAKGQYGTALRLKCAKHPDTFTEITEPEHFDHVADGGCSRLCNFRLACGHQCNRRCHPDDPKHIAGFCPQPCSRLRSADDCPYQHPCPLLCGDTCGPCKVPIASVMLPCNHVATNIPCHMAMSPETISCKVKVEVVMAGCAHLLKVPCGESEKFGGSEAREKCFETCGKALSCGHTCDALCGHCHAKGTEELNDGSKHVKCSAPCGREFMCGHSCQESCHAGVECKLCCQPCPVKCAHSKCPNVCHNVCAPCIERCEWTCEHEGPCIEPCGAPCTRKLCDKRCAKLLPCGHQCPSVCGEVCPNPDIACKLCARPNAQRHVVDLILFQTLEDYSVEENGPLIALACGHVYSMESLDGLMQLAHHYDRDADLRWGAPKQVTGQLNKMISCPDCRVPITGVLRYGRVINKSLLDIMTCKFQVAGERKLGFLRKQLHEVPHTESAEEKHSRKLLKHIESQLRDMRDTKHPLQKIYEAARSKSSRASAQLLSIPALDQSVQAASRLLLLEIKVKFFEMAKTKLLTTSASDRNSSAAAVPTDKWKQIIREFSIDKEVRSLITFMTQQQMLSSAREALCVAGKDFQMSALPCSFTILTN